MRWKVTAALALVASMILLAPRMSSAITSITPVHPTTADSVRVTCGSEFPRRCWTFSQPTCTVIQPDTLRVLILVGYCLGEPSCFCNDFPGVLTRTCNFGKLAAGSYVASYVEQHTNPYDILPSFVQNVSFTVTDSSTVPARRRSWGTLKSIYR